MNKFMNSIGIKSRKAFEKKVDINIKNNQPVGISFKIGISFFQNDNWSINLKNTTRPANPIKAYNVFIRIP